MIDENQFGKGANDRPEHYELPDAYNHAEIAGNFAPAVWKEKALKDFATYPKRNQGTTQTCTCYAQSKLLSVDELSENGNWRELSPHSLYPLVMAPGGGANGLEVAFAAAKYGITLEALFASDGLDENEMQKSDGYVLDAKQVALIYKSDLPVQCLADFETIASIIDNYRAQGKKKAVAITLMGQNNGTWLNPFPKPPADSKNIWYHRVAVVDFGLINGKKFLAIDNSWGETIGLAGQQFIGEDYLPYIYGAVYTLNIPDDWKNATPAPAPVKYQWNTDLQIGSNGPDVMALQKALQTMGMFPVASVVAATGIFGGITKQSVILFQQSFGIPATGTVGPMSRAKLNSLFQ